MWGNLRTIAVQMSDAVLRGTLWRKTSFLPWWLPLVAAHVWSSSEVDFKERKRGPGGKELQLSSPYRVGLSVTASSTPALTRVIRVPKCQKTQRPSAWKHHIHSTKLDICKRFRRQSHACKQTRLGCSTLHCVEAASFLWPQRKRSSFDVLRPNFFHLQYGSYPGLVELFQMSHLKKNIQHPDVLDAKRWG